MLPAPDIDDSIRLIRRFMAIAIDRQFEALKRGESFDLAASIGQQIRRWRADEIAWEKAGSHWACFHKHVRGKANAVRDRESPQQAALHFPSTPS